MKAKVGFDIVCQYCGTNFHTTNQKKLFCSALCKQEYHNAKKRNSKPKKPKHIPKDLEYFYEWKQSHTAPKKYADIKKANRALKIQGGWRGTPVAGPAMCFH